MNIFLAKKDLQTFPKQDIYTLTKYYELSAQNHGDLLWLLALSIHSQDAPLLSGGLMSFSKKLIPLLERTDSLIPSLDPTFVSQFLRLASEQRISKSMVLPEQEKNLKNNPDWKKLQDFKAIFDVPLADPTWVIESFLHGGISRLEDIKSRLQPAMKEFFYLHNNKIINDDKDEKGKKKKQISYKDFCGLKGCESKEGLEDFLEQYEEQLSEFRGKVQKKETARKGAKLLLDGETVTVYRPITKEGACYYGRGTRWCTAATKGGNMFDRYNQYGPLYILIPKKAEYEKEKYQVQFVNEQYMNEKDEGVKMNYLLKRFPELNNFLPFLAGNGKFDKLLLLLKQGERRGIQEAIVDLVNYRQWKTIEDILDMEITPDVESLNLIIEQDKIKLANKIMDKGVTPNIESLNFAIEKNRMKLATKIMDKVTPNIHSLNLAIENRKTILATEIMNREVSPNIQSLNLAIKNKKTILANEIMNRGVSPDVESFNLALTRNNEKLLERFINHPEPFLNVKSLNLAIKNNNMKFVNVFLDEGVTPNTESMDWALSKNNNELIERLIDQKVSDIEFLNLAIKNDNMEVVKRLLETGVKPSFESLTIAMKHKDKAIAKIVLNFWC